MATPAQATANLANAQLSTGPRTEEGKAVSSRNALKHGLTAQTVLLPGEDQAAWLQLCDETLQCWKPANALEKGLIQLLCNTQWRISRCARLEAAVLSADTPDFKAFDVISKHEARLKKTYTTTLKEVRDLIACRIAEQQAAMKEAVLIRRADKIKKRETDLSALGFDFSTQQVDAAINRKNALDRAHAVVSEFEYSKSAYAFKQ